MKELAVPLAATFTENSCKYSLQSFEDLVEQAGFVVSCGWLAE